jgi:hypothetical protein
MNKSRQIGSFMAASVAALGMATVGFASPAAAAGPGPRPVSTWLRAVQAGTSSWVTLGWRTDRRVCDVRITVDGGRRIDIDYPGHRRFTSFSRDDSLRAGEVDYAAIRVTPDYDRAGVAVLRATIRYDRCGWHARRELRSSFLALPVVRRGWHLGDDGPGHNGLGNDGRGNNGPGNNGPGNDGRGNNGPGNNGPGNNGRGNDGRGNNDLSHGTPSSSPSSFAPLVTAPSSPAPGSVSPSSSAPSRGGPDGQNLPGRGNASHTPSAGPRTRV